MEERIRDLAALQGRNVEDVVEEAMRQYLEAISITDIDSSQIAETQSALLAELPDISDWKTREA